MVYLLILLGISNGKQPWSLKTGSEVYPAKGISLDTVYFEDFEGDSVLYYWEVYDFTAQDAGYWWEGHDTVYWHVDTVKVYQGDSTLWCGRYAPDGWNYPIGYGNEWGQFAITPPLDLSGVPAGDTVLFVFMHYYDIESPGPWPPFDGWDCINLWISTDNGSTWEVIEPDTLRYGDKEYKFSKSFAWYWNALLGCDQNCAANIPGWGGESGGWVEVGFDLTPYIGDTVLIKFALVSDPAESDEDGGYGPYGGWWIDSISLVHIETGTGNTDVLWYEDFEDGASEWTFFCKSPKGKWWRLTDTHAASGTYSFVCADSTETYIPCGIRCLLASPLIDLTEVLPTLPCTLYYDIIFCFTDIDSGECGDFDAYTVLVSLDSGKTWQYADPYFWVGCVGSWVTAISDLTPYIGKVIRVGFLVWTDPDELLPPPMYIDNVVVKGKLPEGLPPSEEILLVDDDHDAVDVWGYGWEEYWKDALSRLGYRFNVVNPVTQEIPDSIYMRRHGMVIWNVGSDWYGWGGPGYSPLTLEERQNILGYLRLGGKLWICGENLFDPADTMIFPALSYPMGIDSVVANVKGDTVFGYTGGLFDGFMAELNFDRINGNNWGYNWIDSLIFSDYIFGHLDTFFLSSNGGVVGYGYKPAYGYNIVYTGFPLAAVEGADARDTIVKRTINYIRPYPPTPRYIDAEEVEGGVRVFWAPNFPRDLGGYRIYRSTDPEAWFTLIGQVGPEEVEYLDTLVEPGMGYYYKVTAFSIYGEESWPTKAVKVTVTTGSAMGTEKEKVLLVYPQVFSDELTLKLSGLSGNVKVELFDVSGRKVANIYEGEVTDYVWKAEALPQGVYFVRISGVDKTETVKVIKIK
ncbi:hypothetical protein DRQ20_00675 [bacterium]|nr:MAG: hypothetical protein DRQ20_00675 [bacterium]